MDNIKEKLLEIIKKGNKNNYYFYDKVDHEIVELNKKFGSRITCTPGNYIPFGSAHESDDSMSEEMIITPSTGANKNYMIIGTVTFIALVTLGAGVYFIKKFNNK